LVDRSRKKGRFLVIVDDVVLPLVSVDSKLISNTPPAFSRRLGYTSAFKFKVSDGYTLFVLVLVTAPDAKVVVDSTELNTDSTPFCMPPKMPSWPDADRGSRTSDPVSTRLHAPAARPNYFSPMTVAQ
jgi:hypothetical protein